MLTDNGRQTRKHCFRSELFDNGDKNAVSLACSMVIRQLLIAR